MHLMLYKKLFTFYCNIYGTSLYLASYLVSVHNVRYLRCCKNFNSSYTPWRILRIKIFARPRKGTGQALISNILNQTHNFIDKLYL